MIPSQPTPWDELHKQHEQYTQLLELRCELLQREVEHLRQQVTQQAVTHSIDLPEDVQRLLPLSTVEELFQHTCELLRRWTSATAAYVLRLLPDGSLEVYPPEHVGHARTLVEEGIIDWLAERGCPALLPDFAHVTSTHSLLLVPLGRTGVRLGALVALGTPSTLSWESLQDRLHSIGTLLGILVDNIESTRIAEDLHNQLQQLQRQLRQTEALAALGKITSIVLHEIGNPLQALLSHVELIEAGKGNAHDHVRRIGTELLRLQQLVAELRQLLYHPTAGSALSAVDLLHVLQQTLHLLQPQFQRDHVRVQLQPHCPTAVILGNAAQLEQLFLNLFLNARDAMPDGGVLRITLSCEGNHLIVECSDTGHGIPADVLEHVFEPFFTTKPQGSGLGLSIARNIVQQHGGDITIASQPSMGTTVTLRFPLMHQVKQADTAPPCETPSS